jgi:hypothetical protein
MRVTQWRAARSGWLSHPRPKGDQRNLGMSRVSYSGSFTLQQSLSSGAPKTTARGTSASPGAGVALAGKSRTAAAAESMRAPASQGGEVEDRKEGNKCTRGPKLQAISVHYRVPLPEEWRCGLLWPRRKWSRGRQSRVHRASAPGAQAHGMSRRRPRECRRRCRQKPLVW